MNLDANDANGDVAMVNASLSSLAQEEEVEEEIDEIVSESDDDSKGPIPSTSTANPAVAAVASSSKGTPGRPRGSAAAARTGGLSASVPLPHYTLTRSSPNTAENPHVFSIKQGVTDGEQSRWPTDTQKNGTAKWNEVLTKDVKKYVEWRTTLALHMAERLGLTSQQDVIFVDVWQVSLTSLGFCS